MSVSEAVKEVTEFEASLLRILRCLMHRVSVDQVLSLLIRSSKRPPCLSQNCVDLIRDGLSKGVTEWLARSGWHSSQFRRSNDPESVASGRLWNRHLHTSMQLTFSRNSLELLLWLTSENFADTKKLPAMDPSTLTLGDRVFLLMAFGALRTTLGATSLLNPAVCSDVTLAALLYPADVAILNKTASIQCDQLFDPKQIWLMEALQYPLAQQWFCIERDKRISGNDTDVLTIGEFQTAVLTSLFEAAEKSRRQDLCLFVLEAGRLLFAATADDQWFHRMDLRTRRMQERTRIYRAGFAWFFSLERLTQWTQQAQSIGYYDDDYRTSQFWKSEWERLNGTAVCQRARQIIDRVDVTRTIGNASN